MLAAAATAMMASTIGAQTIPDQTPLPETNLDIPANLQIFGKFDPNIRKPTAIVNDSVITATDVDQRVALLIFANELKLNGDDRDKLKLQVLRQLIDETLQIQEAAANKIVIKDAEIGASFDRLSKTFNKTPPEMRVFLRQQHSSDRSLQRQIEGELAWQRYLRKEYEGTTNVGDEEVKAILARLEALRGTEEFELHEIFLSATPVTQQQVFSNARQLLAGIQKGQRPFDDFAREFSQASSRAQGGDLGWVRLATLPESLSQVATTMKVGQVVGPIETPGGFSILYLVDKRQILTADQRDAKLNLKQLTVRFPPNTTQADATLRASNFAKAIQSLQGCGSVEKVAATINAEVVDNASVRIRDLPVALQEIMLKLQVGQATPPFGSPQQGVRSLVLCGIDAAKGADLPRMDQVRDQLEQQRVNLRAQQKLRDLRRDAVVEYR